jgi:hypothetical protein
MLRASIPILRLFFYPKRFSFGMGILLSLISSQKQ